MLNEQLIAELPQMLDLRVPYFDPSFEAMIRMQCKFAEDGYENMSAVQRWGFFFFAQWPHVAHHVRSGPPDISRIMSGTTMLLVSWTLRYGFRSF